MNKNPTALIVLDGFGISPNQNYNAIYHAYTPHLDRWFAIYPHTLLEASGPAVGLLPGVAGNSQTGHLTLGAGRVIKQGVSHLHEIIDDTSFFHNKRLTDALNQLHNTGKTLHIIGLLSDAGVHSHTKHLFAFIKAAEKQKIKKIVIHALLDGRDVLPQSAATHLEQLQTFIAEKTNCLLGSICGRFYGMDRDANWKRIRAYYNMLTEPRKPPFVSWQQALEYYYTQNITDEFIPPTLLDEQACIETDDGIIFFNTRPDRARQLTRAFIDPHFNEFPVKKLNLTFFITPYAYSTDLPTTVLFPPEPLINTLKEVLAQHGKTIFTIAETEKYAHVTYFFTGGKEVPLPHETRVIIDSLEVKQYSEHPEMSAAQITQSVLHSLQTNPCDFYLINYANADMVGHSGNFEATKKAIDCLDHELGLLYKQIVETMGGRIYLTADHGNAEDMYDEQAQQPRTSHTTNPVPFLILDKQLKNKSIHLPLTTLADIAPFILNHMGIRVPHEMVGSK